MQTTTVDPIESSEYEDIDESEDQEESVAEHDDVSSPPVTSSPPPPPGEKITKEVEELSRASSKPKSDPVRQFQQQVQPHKSQRRSEGEYLPRRFDLLHNQRLRST